MSGVHTVSEAQDVDFSNTLQDGRGRTVTGQCVNEYYKPERFRVALFVGSFKQPVWIDRVIQEVSGSSFAEISLIVKCYASDNSEKPPNRTLLSRCDSLLWDIYSRLDNRSLCPYSDPFDEFDVRSAVHPECELIYVTAFQKGGQLELRDEELAKIHAQRLDVILDLGNMRLSRTLSGLASYGVWTSGLSFNSSLRNGQPGFWEVMGNETTTELTLQMSVPDKACDRVLYRSWTATDLYSVKGTRSKVYWKSSNAVVRTLRNLHELGPKAFREDHLYADISFDLGPRKLSPNNSQMALFLAKMAVKHLRLRFRNYTLKEQWFLAYSLEDVPITEQDLDKFHYMEPPKGKFWADPFPIEREGKYFIFLEEFLYKSMKAHISVLEMDSNGIWKAPVKVLERDYHLSYPFLFEWEGKLYMIPETKGNKTIEVYSCAEFPLKWEFEKVLVKNVEAVDSTLFEKDGYWWLFCNIGGKDFASNDELHLFHSETPFGPWQPHKRNPVKSDARSSRPAGRLFYRNANLFRPAQDCSERMGGAMGLNCITSLTTEDFKEEQVSRIEPSWTKGLYGVHTLNSAGRLTVIDCFRYVPKYLA